MKKILIVMLAVLMACSIFAACSKPGGGGAVRPADGDRGGNAAACADGKRHAGCRPDGYIPHNGA